MSGSGAGSGAAGAAAGPGAGSGAAGPIRLGMLAWNQYTTWPAMRDAAIRADRLGYDDIWT